MHHKSLYIHKYKMILSCPTGLFGILFLAAAGATFGRLSHIPELAFLGEIPVFLQTLFLFGSGMFGLGYNTSPLVHD